LISHFFFVFCFCFFRNKKCTELFAEAENFKADTVIVQDKILEKLEKVDPAAYFLTLLQLARKHKKHILQGP
jgi:hypothetical protein